MALSRILVTGAAGKVGQAFIRRFLADPRFEAFTVRALCHNRKLTAGPRLEVVTGSIEQRGAVDEAMSGVTHLLHLATSKETPESIMDVAVKGMFWMLEHYYIQYGLNGCCLRAPWIMEKDDFKYQLSFGDDVFGGPRWRDLVTKEQADAYAKSGAVPIMLDPNGQPVKRNFVHVDDLVTAILAAIDHPKARQQLFNVCMDEPIDYGELAAYLARSRGLPGIPVRPPYHSTWLDHAKA